MQKTKNISIQVQGMPVAVLSDKDGDYISLTDMLRAKDGEFAIIKSHVESGIEYPDFLFLKE